MAKVTEPCRGRADPGPFFGLWGLEFRPCLSGLFERNPVFVSPGCASLVTLLSDVGRGDVQTHPYPSPSRARAEERAASLLGAALAQPLQQGLGLWGHVGGVRFPFLAQPVYRRVHPPDWGVEWGTAGSPPSAGGVSLESGCGLAWFGDQPSTAWHHGNEGLRAQIPALSPGSPTS